MNEQYQLHRVQCTDNKVIFQTPTRSIMIGDKLIDQDLREGRITFFEGRLMAIWDDNKITEFKS